MGSQFEYFYNVETRQYKYFVIPQVLILDTQFSSLSDRAKILYCIMLDRSSISAKNGWIDDKGRVYIIMTRDEIMEKLVCSHTTAQKFTQELIEFGLITKRRRGQGNPDWIYVMNFNKLVEERKVSMPEEPLLQEGKESLSQEDKKSLLQEGKESCPKLDLHNKTNIKESSSSRNTEHVKMEEDEYIKQRLGYERACKMYSQIIVDLLFTEIVKRGQSVWSRVNEEAFQLLCNNITNYHGRVANVGAYVAKCIDNMLLAASANVNTAVPSPLSAEKNRNSFNKFTQNTYDFDALEKKLMERS